MAHILFSQTPVSGKFDTGANWVGGVAPTNGDSWTIDGLPTAFLEVNIDDGLDQSANVFVNGQLGPYYRGQFGNKISDPFLAGFSGVLAISGGAAKHFFNSSAGKTIAEVQMMGCGADHLGEIWVAGTVTKGIVQRGTLWGYSGTWQEAHIAAQAGSSAALLRIVNADIATVYAWNGIGNIEVGSVTGRIRQLINTSATVSISATGQLDAATIAGGKVDDDSLIAHSGAIFVHGGEYNLVNVQSQTLARLEVFSGGTVRRDRGIVNDVITIFANHDGRNIQGYIAA